ncbi:MAG: exo-alpha-sialidase, partial [Nitrospirae bacterium]|nr:exo-alpha-sialidase [Nitrospirota bacterium]
DTLGNNDIFMKKSTDNGLTWVWQQISNNAGNSQSPVLAVDNTNAIYVVWQDNTLGSNDIFMKKSTDNGVTWVWQQISNNAGNSQLPVLAVDNTNAIYVVWQDDTLTPGNSDIFMKKSTDNGLTWVWQQISNNAGNSIMPAITK